jgi:hypothetical protein
MIVGFASVIVGFASETVDFENESVDFVNESFDFVSESVDFVNESVDFVLRWFVLYFSMFIKLDVSFALTSFLPFPPPIILDRVYIPCQSVYSSSPGGLGQCKL